MKYEKLDPYQTRDFNIWIMVTQEGYTEANAKRAAIWGELMQAAGKRKCNKVGHKMKDESYGGPESGRIAFSCTRCGWSHCQDLY